MKIYLKKSFKSLKKKERKIIITESMVTCETDDTDNH